MEATSARTSTRAVEKSAVLTAARVPSSILELPADRTAKEPRASSKTFLHRAIFGRI